MSATVIINQSMHIRMDIWASNGLRKRGPYVLSLPFTLFPARELQPWVLYFKFLHSVSGTIQIAFSFLYTRITIKHSETNHQEAADLLILELTYTYDRTTLISTSSLDISLILLQSNPAFLVHRVCAILPSFSLLLLHLALPHSGSCWQFTANHKTLAWLCLIHTRAVQFLRMITSTFREPLLYSQYKITCSSSRALKFSFV